MHELSIAQTILDILQQERRKHGFRSVQTVHLALGPLSNVVPESLVFCFDAIKAGTVAAGAAMRVRATPMTAVCRDCGGAGVFDDWETVCPACGSGSMEVTEGGDLRIEDIEVEDE